jgi:hypothetical protein
VRIRFRILSVTMVAAALISGGESRASFLAGRESNFTLFAVENSAPARDSVLGELIRLQHDKSLTITWFQDVLTAVSFNQRSATGGVRLPSLMPKMSGAVSLDGTQVAGYARDSSGRFTLEVVRLDGLDPREYQGIAPVDFCWSHDNTSIALTNSHGQRTASMEIVNVSTKAQPHPARAQMAARREP